MSDVDKLLENLDQVHAQEVRTKTLVKALKQRAVATDLCADEKAVAEAYDELVQIAQEGQVLAHQILADCEAGGN